MVSQLLEFYANYGISLRAQGIMGAIIPLELSETALEHFCSLEWIVLGGDIYKKECEGQFSCTYDNWYYEGEISHESIIRARAFFSTLKKEDGYVLFSIRIL